MHGKRTVQDIYPRCRNSLTAPRQLLCLLQDVEDNVLIEMDYVPVNDYVFHVVNIEENGIKKQGLPCMTIKQAVSQFMAEIQD